MENDTPAPLSAGAQAARRGQAMRAAGAAGPLTPLRPLARAWRGLLARALSAPTWALALAAGVGLAAAVLLALT